MLVVAVGGLIHEVAAVYALLAVYLWVLFGWESLTCWLATPAAGVEATDHGTND
jgi:hypothetical protein